MTLKELHEKLKDKSIFRNELGKRYNTNLFYELNQTDMSQAIYTTKRKDHKGYFSLYKLYMACDDPLEHTFASTYFEDLDHWEFLANHTLLKEEVAYWRYELETKIRGEALARIRMEAKINSDKSFMCNKFLLDKGWKSKEDVGRGRPTKEDIQKEANKIFEKQSRLNEDFERIMN